MHQPSKHQTHRQKHSIPKSTRAMFVLLMVCIALAVAGGAMLVVSVPLLKQRGQIANMMYMRGHSITLGSERVTQPERREHLRACYADPEIDLNTISWNLLSRPAPFVGYRPEPGMQDEGPINAQQIREAEDLPRPKPADEYRIFLIGGSLAYGIGAPDMESRISDYMETALRERNFAPGRRVVVWNAAMCAWTTTHERIMIENILSEWEPDLVVALTGGNDVQWAQMGHNIMDQRTWEDEMYFELINHALAVGGVRPYDKTPPDVAEGELGLDAVEYRFLKNIRLSGLALAPRGVPLVVAIQPLGLTEYKPLTAGEQAWLKSEDDYRPGRVRYFHEGSEQLRTALRDADAKGGLPENVHAVDVHDVFAGREDAIYLDTMHVGDKGAKLIGERLAYEIDRLKQAGELGAGQN